jgi:hypothetical protein
MASINVSELFETRFKRAICQKLLEYDPGIIEIIQFGSSLYAPSCAKDIDLLILTTSRKAPHSAYMDKILELNLPFDVDIVVSELGMPISKSLLAHVIGAYEVLYGSGDVLSDLVEQFNPTFNEVHAAIETGKKNLADAKSAEDSDVKDSHIRIAFNQLFHAARLASMVYIGTEKGRWGKIKSELPNRYRDEFQEFIDTLHIDYFYNGNYPRDKIWDEFERWCAKVEAHVKNIESAVKEVKT